MLLGKVFWCLFIVDWTESNLWRTHSILWRTKSTIYQQLIDYLNWWKKKGFECRGTKLALRATAWENLLRATRRTGPLTTNPLEASLSKLPSLFSSSKNAATQKKKWELWNAVFHFYCLLFFLFIDFLKILSSAGHVLAGHQIPKLLQRHPRQFL